jgi:uncharacterized transporter YbjL
MNEVAQTMSLLSAVAIIGLGFGSIRFKGVSLGIGGILFGGILVGHSRVDALHQKIDSISSSCGINDQR